MEQGDQVMQEIAPPSPESSSPKPQTIFLHILSPSPEVPTKLTFPSIPVATTVGELKAKIQDAVATNPAPDRQRLIYRGRALVKDSDTMKNVFGQVAIDDPVSHSLHLVLPPSSIPPPSTQATATAPNTTPPNLHPQHHPIPPRPASADQNFSSAGQGASIDLQNQPTVVRGGFHAPHQPANHAHNQIPPPQAQVPIHIQAALNSHFAALSQQVGQQLAMGVMTPPQQHHEHQFTPPVQPSFQQVITQQQQARAAARRQGITDTSIPDSVSGDHDRQTQPRQSEQTTAPGTPPSQTLSGAGSADTLAHEDQRPSGQSWRITVNGGSLAIPSAHMGHGPIPQPNTMPLASFGAHGSFNVPADALSSSMASPRNEAGQPLPTPSSPPTQDFDLGNRVRIQTVLPLQQRLLIVERIVASGHAPPEDQVNELRSRLEELRRHRNNIPDGLERSLTARIVNVSNRAEQIRRSAGRNVTSPPRTQQPPAPTQTSATPLVYLLSSPSGPHALLISPSGLFSTAPRTVPLTNDFRPFTANIPPQRFNQAQVPVPFANNLAQQPVAHEPPIHEQGAQQQPGQARDIARILLPLGGHLWLLIRLFGFVYLFTGGGGWRRAILLGIGAFVVFIAQIGIFHPVQQAVWEPLRRHLEGLVPLAGNGRANARVAPGAAAAAGIDGEQRALGEESLIRQAAERLLRERDQRNVGLVRQNLRRLERAVAIFLASLVPGVGERHIAARDAAEAVRMVEELERAEERVREEQSRGEDGVEESLGNEAAPTAMASGSNEDDGSVGHSQQPQQDQQPLVDI